MLPGTACQTLWTILGMGSTYAIGKPTRRPSLQTVAPSRQGMVVAGEGRFTWDGRAALGADAGILLVLGHALSMQAMQGGQATKAKLASHKMAPWRRGGMLPQASVEPATRRATRAWLRRHMPLAPTRAARLAHVQHTHSPYHLPAIGAKIADQAHREGVAERFAAAAVHKSIAVDRARIPDDAPRLRDGALPIVTTAQHHHATTRSLRPTVPGIGTMLRRGLLSAIHEGTRFPRGQDLVSECRLVQWAREAAGQHDGTSGAKSGTAHRQGAFAEAAVLCLRAPPAAQQSLARWENKHAKGHAWTSLAPQLARAVYDRLQRPGACDTEPFCQRSTLREGSGCACGLTGHQGDDPQRGARHGGMPGVRERPAASRSPGPAPRAVMGHPLSRRFSTALVAHGRRGRLLPRAWFSLDTFDALRPLFA
jgi:hypothetical protein